MQSIVLFDHIQKGKNKRTSKQNKTKAEQRNGWLCRKWGRTNGLEGRDAI
jgi:hypothetical protein